MNTANLQLEGLLMAMAALNRLLVDRSLLTQEEIELSLRQVEARLSGEDKVPDLSPANRDAIAFPVRLLQLANGFGPDQDLPSFTELAKRVAETKKAYNDQQ